MWIPGHLADIESDMSAIHRVNDIDDMPAPKFFAYAYRLPCYRGVMRERAIAYQREQDDDAPQATAAPAREQQSTARKPQRKPSRSPRMC